APAQRVKTRAESALALRPRHGVQQRDAALHPERRRARALRSEAAGMRLLPLLLLLLAGPLHAEKADKDKPTEVEANRMSADDVRRLSIFDGNVALNKGTMRVLADRRVVRQDAGGYQ